MAEVVRRPWLRLLVLRVLLPGALLGGLAVSAGNLYVMSKSAGDIAPDVASAPARPAAIVLGNSIFPGGVLSSLLAARCQVALELFRAGKVQKIFLSGAYLPQDDYDEPGSMASFLEWYVLEWPLDDGATPVRRALDDVAWSPVERRGLAALASSHHSLFELYGVADHVLELEDVIGGARFHVHERRKTMGFSPGDLFEARVVWDGDSPVFGRTFLFHPPDAREVVLDWVEGAVERGVARDEILFHLSRHHIRWHRQGHLGAAKIYKGDG